MYGQSQRNNNAKTGATMTRKKHEKTFKIIPKGTPFADNYNAKWATGFVFEKVLSQAELEKAAAEDRMRVCYASFWW